MTERTKSRVINSSGEQRQVPLSEIVVLAQTRRGLSPVHEELIDSIDAVGLLYPPLVAEMSVADFEDYLDFTRKLGETRSISDFGKQIVNGCVTLMVDGGSRAAALGELQKRDPDTPIMVGCIALSGIATAEDVITRQIAANIQRRPSADDEAHSLAASYEMAREIDPGVSRAAFASIHGLSARHLSDCLYYAELPNGIKDMVGKDGLPFTLAVQIARQREILEFYYEKSIPRESNTPSFDIEKRREDAVLVEMLRYANWYTKGKSNARKATREISQTIDGIKVEMVGRAAENLKALQELLREQRSVRSNRANRITELTEAMVGMG